MFVEPDQAHPAVHRADLETYTPFNGPPTVNPNVRFEGVHFERSSSPPRAGRLFAVTLPSDQSAEIVWTVKTRPAR
ncbi:hypothetical protein AB0B45_19855 [Nonomuraea sp. NPDC049152]|uniref:hypothetical protein n=1 Tax=Nonomuraea sp. NPDC049152 TaxID=3154350 RepID=UPI00340EFC01